MPEAPGMPPGHQMDWKRAHVSSPVKSSVYRLRAKCRMFSIGFQRFRIMFNFVLEIIVISSVVYWIQCSITFLILQPRERSLEQSRKLTTHRPAMGSRFGTQV